MDAPKVKRPGFATFFLPGNCAEEMRIPSKFMRSIQGACPENVSLQDRYNNLWQVKLVKAGDSWYFRDGWAKFVKDHTLEVGEVLTYEYFGEGLFGFTIFDLSGCETKGVGGPLCTHTEEYVRTIEVGSEDEHETDDDDCSPVLEQEDGLEVGGVERPREVGTGPRANPHGRNRRNTDLYGQEIFKSRLLPRPANPYFVTNFIKGRSRLFIPVEVAQSSDIELPEKVTLEDPDGRRWSVKRRVWKDGRVLYSGGWGHLCKRNDVENGDKCICEFIRRGDGEMRIRVSFVRANRE